MQINGINNVSFCATLKRTSTTNEFMDQFPEKQQKDFIEILDLLGSKEDTVEICDYSRIVETNHENHPYDRFSFLSERMTPDTEKAVYDVDLKINDNKVKINIPIHCINSLKCLAWGILKTNILEDSYEYLRHGFEQKYLKFTEKLD